ncbi:NRDE family protein [Alteromonas sp. BL110]|uniref:NRDE family protein n=2 Tax=Alteromonas sp. BL110 TaxID=1714845 RepID=UPI0015FFAC7F|nr:NRDE family protein [Alteromonas sp. BL110]
MWPLVLQALDGRNSMCTLSWQKTEDGTTRIYFNRDEQRTRKSALKPQTFLLDGVYCTMPIDPEGQGTWISVNEHGLAVCLLNYYQGEVPQGPLISRGLLVKHLASANSYSDVLFRLRRYELERTAPFTLAIFDRDFTGQEIQSWIWDGHNLAEKRVKPPLVSAALHFEEAYQYRHSLFRLLSKTLPSHEIGPQFHRSYNKQTPFLSPLMNREDARTVSLTSIFVSKELQDMYYESIEESLFSEAAVHKCASNKAVIGKVAIDNSLCEVEQN